MEKKKKQRQHSISDIEIRSLNELGNESISNEAVYRTSPATPGLLKM